MDYQAELQARIGKYKKGSDYLSKLNIRLGQGILDEALKEVPKYGKKVLFCTGTGAMKKLGFYQKFLDFFNKNNISVVHYEGIIANPTIEVVQKGVELAKKNSVDFIVSLGGGSVIDTGKAIAVGVYGNIWDFVEKKAAITKALPIIACTSTSGTGSHVTPYAVISNSKTVEKKTLKDDNILPKLSIIDIDITKHAPPYVVATTGFDVLSHGIEVYSRNDTTPTANEFALTGIDLVNKNLYRSYKSSGDLESKIGMARADIYTGIALALIGTHLPHAISHPISARFPEITHGQALAYVAPKSFGMIAEKADSALSKKLETISASLGGDGNLASTLSSFVKKLGLDKKAVSFSENDCELIVQDVKRYRWPSVEKSPVPVTEEEVREIVFASLK